MSGEEKLHNCKFRSETELVKVIRRCSCRGGNYEKKGYFCNKKQIFEVTPDICQNCELFESR
jgi:hypothetical protein